MSRKIDWDDTYEAEPARIKRTFIGREDHGIMCLTVTFEGQSWGQSFGPISLGDYNRPDEAAKGMEMLTRLVDLLGDVTTWNNREVFVLRRKDEGYSAFIRGIAVSNSRGERSYILDPKAEA